MAVRTPEEFEAGLARFLYERSEEGRAVRVGEKETSEQAAIVERYADLFSREQHDAMREAEATASGEDRERIFRLGEAAVGGLIVRELADESDRLENAILAARVEFRGESLPLRAAQAQLAVLDDYAARDELGDLAADVSARFNCERHELLRRGEELDAELSGDADPVRRSAERKAIDLHALSAALGEAAGRQLSSWEPLRERWPTASSARSARRSPRRTTCRTSAACPRSPRSMRRSARCRSAWRRSRRSGSTSPRTGASGSTWTTGRRRARARA